ncbi:hypothetical protein EVAR_9289_1 [Eumeta japonica]|uniref:Uncharacterized protein n=1 Tax=Eumeta variegata TaxID=151549 RepID=A0A4C1TNV8_EUMVA|nr:hypothetical protein EVAR_9289_1 [Eumeta japonica]
MPLCIHQGFEIFIREEHASLSVIIYSKAEIKRYCYAKYGTVNDHGGWVRRRKSLRRRGNGYDVCSDSSSQSKKIKGVIVSARSAASVGANDTRSERCIHRGPSGRQQETLNGSALKINVQAVGGAARVYLGMCRRPGARYKLRRLRPTPRPQNPVHYSMSRHEPRAHKKCTGTCFIVSSEFTTYKTQVACIFCIVIFIILA